jgi:hypothetical protein
MATRKSYAYQIKGNKISLLENQFGYGSGQDVITVDGSSINHKQYTLDEIGPTGKPSWVSPASDVTDGIEIEYAYSPYYRINDADDTKAISAYTESSGYLSLTVAQLTLAADDWVLIQGSNKFNGLHQVLAGVTDSTTLALKTKYNGGAVSEASTMLTDITVLQDESYELDLPPYLSKALVYYLKAKQAEENLDIERKEYFMREFKKIVEKHESSKISGPRRIMGFGMTR